MVSMRMKSTLNGEGGNPDIALMLNFRTKRIRLSTLLVKTGLDPARNKISFYRLNGAQLDPEDWINDGEIIDIVPVE